MNSSIKIISHILMHFDITFCLFCKLNMLHIKVAITPTICQQTTVYRCSWEKITELTVVKIGCDGRLS